MKYIQKENYLAFLKPPNRWRFLWDRCYEVAAYTHNSIGSQSNFFRARVHWNLAIVHPIFCGAVQWPRLAHPRHTSNCKSELDAPQHVLIAGWNFTAVQIWSQHHLSTLAIWRPATTKQCPSTHSSLWQLIEPVSHHFWQSSPRSSGSRIIW